MDKFEDEWGSRPHCEWLAQVDAHLSCSALASNCISVPMVLHVNFDEGMALAQIDEMRLATRLETAQ